MDQAVVNSLKEQLLRTLTSYLAYNINSLSKNKSSVFSILGFLPIDELIWVEVRGGAFPGKLSNEEPQYRHICIIKCTWRNPQKFSVVEIFALGILISISFNGRFNWRTVAFYN